MKNTKKNEQLGMNYSTASYRLVKDILFQFVADKGVKCHHCGRPLCRDTFSIEHKTPWLDSNDPLKNFFDLDNVSFSHKSCNYSASRRIKSKCGTEGKYASGCRCGPCKDAASEARKSRYEPEKRKRWYAEHGH